MYLLAPRLRPLPFSMFFVSHHIEKNSCHFCTSPHCHVRHLRYLWWFWSSSFSEIESECYRKPAYCVCNTLLLFLTPKASSFVQVSNHSQKLPGARNFLPLVSSLRPVLAGFWISALRLDFFFPDFFLSSLLRHCSSQLLCRRASCSS